jgi:hypothetical protein
MSEEERNDGTSNFWNIHNHSVLYPLAARGSHGYTITVKFNTFNHPA